jgi:hypothetical protein
MTARNIHIAPWILTDSVPANVLPALRAEHSSELVIAPYSPPPTAAEPVQRFGIEPRHRKRSPRSIGGSWSIRWDSASRRVRLRTPGTWNYDPQSWAWNSANDADHRRSQTAVCPGRVHRRSPLHLRLLFAQSRHRRTAIPTPLEGNSGRGHRVPTRNTGALTRHDKSR